MTEAPPAVVGDRYEIVRRLGRGSQGETFLAHDEDRGEVVLKRFSIREMRNWKSLELFQREIATLTILDHPAIPAFVDDVEFDGSHYLVQEYVEGEVLADVVAQGPMPPDQIRVVAQDVLTVLTYLHELTPPVVHRDVKPSNIIRRPDGKHALVDFGGVQMIVAQDTGGSTVIGTTGYMPSEQLVGRAEPRSDLYALGATLAHLATGIHPSELPTKRLRIDWRGAAPSVPDELADLIDAMLDPAPEDRPPSARAALEELDGTAVVASEDALSKLSPIVASMERRMRRSPQFLKLTVANGQNRGMLLGGTMGVMMVVAILAIDLWILKAFVVLALGVAAKLASNMFAPAEQLVIEASGQVEVHGTSPKGKPTITRGTLVFDDGQLFVSQLNVGVVRVAKSLTSDEAAWFAHEAQQFVENAQRRAQAPEPDLEPEVEVDTESDAPLVVVPEPEPEPEVEPVYESLPDRESFFDRDATEEAAMTPFDRAREEFQALPRVERPGDDVPRYVTARIRMNGHTSFFDLRPELRLRHVAQWLGILILAGGFSFFIQSLAPFVIAFAAALVAGILLRDYATEQRLRLFEGNQFLLQTKGRPDVEGRLLPEVRTDSESLVLLTDSGNRILVGEDLERTERQWVGHLLEETMSGHAVKPKS